MKIYSIDAFTCRQCQSTVMCRHLKYEENKPEEVACEDCGAVYNVVITSGRREGLQIKLREETSEGASLPETAFVFVSTTYPDVVLAYSLGEKVAWLVEDCLLRPNQIWEDLPKEPGLWKWKGSFSKVDVGFVQGFGQGVPNEIQTEYGAWSRPTDEEILFLMKGRGL